MSLTIHNLCGIKEGDCSAVNNLLLEEVTETRTIASLEGLTKLEPQEAADE